MRYVLLVAYDGGGYGGWQIQKNAESVQGKLAAAIKTALGVEANPVASGRTDAGVHAAGQVCHFDGETSVPPERIADALNIYLPKDISVLKSAAAPEGFHATASAKKKTYCYRAYVDSRRNPLKDGYSTKIDFKLDLQKLKSVVQYFIGEHDFKAYCSSGSTIKTTVREIYSIDVKINKSLYGTDIELYFTGNGFLYNMVRTLAGTMFDYAAGRLDGERIKRSLDTGDRAQVGKTMPPQGLTLEEVDYGVKLFI